ncbi:LLM class F420-dependent oxidoreductase [Streptomyces cacaoi]|uniref:LLM class F420-dependent oxidoreductase n=1 Tax=Streptomyces cacaoi TaxID=1898 RepID=A0A4Y3R9B6_STRCI|nr:LLM class F420-dependent oxidoreductase [Streptomyces cacaoi]NNG89476.1 LLM class F420-dependent oxidoreductase [Streptomyces cacaoi]GEB53408.1 LLM class F420-dependent oxidoreductase [Streptomyces cacaoi]
MKIGVLSFVTDEGIRPGALARAVEERGFESLFVAEHSHIPVGSAGPDGGELARPHYRSLDPFVTLAAAAAATSTLRLGTAVALLVQRDVLHTAKEAASVDVLSGGRLILGVGAGWLRQEMRHHGTDPRTRGRLLDEQLAALKEIWTRDEAEFHGEFVDFGPLHMWPKPVQRPHPPLWIGGGSEASLRRVAAHGDGWFPVSATPEDIRRARAELDAAGRADAVLTVPGDAAEPASLERFAEAGAERAVFMVDTAPEDATLRTLDRLAESTAPYRD